MYKIYIFVPHLDMLLAAVFAGVLAASLLCARGRSSMSLRAALALACCAVSGTHAAIDADEITSLPGWDGPLHSRQWSGYLEVRASSHCGRRSSARICPRHQPPAARV